MASKPESRFIDKVNNCLPIPGRAGSRKAMELFEYPVYYEKISNPYKGGVPDCWYGGTRRDAWIEYKWVEKVPKKGIRAADYLTPLQMHWFESHADAEHRRHLIVVGTPLGALTILPVNAVDYVGDTWERFDFRSLQDFADMLYRVLHGKRLKPAGAEM